MNSGVETCGLWSAGSGDPRKARLAGCYSHPGRSISSSLVGRIVQGVLQPFPRRSVQFGNQPLP